MRGKGSATRRATSGLGLPPTARLVSLLLLCTAATGAQARLPPLHLPTQRAAQLSSAATHASPADGSAHTSKLLVLSNGSSRDAATQQSAAQRGPAPSFRQLAPAALHDWLAAGSQHGTPSNAQIASTGHPLPAATAHSVHATLRTLQQTPGGAPATVVVLPGIEGGTGVAESQAGRRTLQHTPTGPIDMAGAQEYAGIGSGTGLTEIPAEPPVGSDIQGTQEATIPAPMPAPVATPTGDSGQMMGSEKSAGCTTYGRGAFTLHTPAPCCHTS